MAFTERRLAGPTMPAGTIETTIYTCNTSVQTTTLVKQIMVCHTAASGNSSVSISIVPYGSTAGANNRIFSNTIIAANETVLLDVSQVLTSGDFISFLSNTGNTTITVSGIENQGGMVLAGLADSAVTTTKIADRNVTSAKLGQNAFLSNDSTGAIFMMETM